MTLILTPGCGIFRCTCADHDHVSNTLLHRLELHVPNLIVSSIMTFVKPTLQASIYTTVVQSAERWTCKAELFKFIEIWFETVWELLQYCSTAFLGLSPCLCASPVHKYFRRKRNFCDLQLLCRIENCHSDIFCLNLQNYSVKKVSDKSYSSYDVLKSAQMFCDFSSFQIVSLSFQLQLCN